MNGGATWTFPGVLQPGSLPERSRARRRSRRGTSTTRASRATSPRTSTNRRTAASAGSRRSPEFGGDKNWLVVDRSGGPSSGHIYGIWQRFGGACCGSNVLTRSDQRRRQLPDPGPRHQVAHIRHAGGRPERRALRDRDRRIDDPGLRSLRRGEIDERRELRP